MSIVFPDQDRRKRQCDNCTRAKMQCTKIGDAGWVCDFCRSMINNRSNIEWNTKFPDEKRDSLQ